MRFSEEPSGEVDEWSVYALLARDCRGYGDVLVQQGDPERSRISPSNYPFGEEILGRVRPAARPVDDFERDTGADAQLCQGRERLARRPDVNRQQGLVHRLHRVAGPDFAAKHYPLSERLEHGACALD